MIAPILLLPDEAGDQRLVGDVALDERRSSGTAQRKPVTEIVDHRTGQPASSSASTAWLPI
jgi:hypothetical protein